MIDDVIKDLQSHIVKAHEALKRDLAKLRTGRANASMLDGVRVDYYGTPTPLAQMATVNVPEARLLTVKPWDRSQVKAVEKAIREAGLGLNPQPDGQLIRVPLPELSQERRLELAKIAGKYSEQARIAVRNVRRDAMDAVKKEKLPEDESKSLSEKVQKLTDEYDKKIDDLFAAKQKEITHV